MVIVPLLLTVTSGNRSGLRIILPVPFNTLNNELSPVLFVILDSPFDLPITSNGLKLIS